MALRDLTDQSAVLDAIAETDRVGEPAFLEKYGFQPSRRFRIAHEDATYPSKALLAAAHGYQFPDDGPLRPGDFSGGRETIAKAQALGFSVVEVDGRADELGVALARFMRLFVEARSVAFSHDHPAVEALRACATLIDRILPAELAAAEVRPSVGRGNWASVPWIAVLHPSVTESTQHGVYPVLLFREDMQAVEVAIIQGVTDLKESLGRRQALPELHRRAALLRAELRDLEAVGFAADSAFDLGSSQLGRDYVEATVVHSALEIDDLAESDVSEKLSELLRAYTSLLVSGQLALETPSATPSPHALMVYVGRRANTNFETGGADGWWGWKDAPTGLDALRPGDLIVFGRGFSGGSARVDAAVWQQHRLREVVVGRVITTPERTDQLVMPDEFAGEAAYPWKLRFERLGAATDVPLEPGDRLSVAAAEGLRRSAIVHGIGVLAPVAGSPLLEAYMAGEATPIDASPTAVATLGRAFADAVENAGLRFSSDDVIAFVAAMLAKPFAILTGQSGSGKTQLAKRLGEWFGVNKRGHPRYLSVPVRPDWTGPEYIFGYPDALRSTAGTEIWAVPSTLEFILRAAAEPAAPYLLLLDEMNLAHVERYFADFLSGVESGDPVLPDVRRQDGRWLTTIGTAQRLPIPRNLFVVGTVNVDETTYLFSPKVLDRAFTFEFHTAADELDPSLRRPSPTTPADPGTTQLFAQVAADDGWHHEHPHPQREALVADLQELHGLLSPSGHDFGHRVFYESLRYAAMLGALGVHDRWDALDRLLLTKLLPKMHGTRSRLERPLRGLYEFAQGPGDDSAPRMPLSAAKLDRMLEVLVDAQFVSFTE